MKFKSFLCVVSSHDRLVRKAGYYSRYGSIKGKHGKERKSRKGERGEREKGGRGESCL